MLVLSRHRHESIVIGEGENVVTMEILEIRGDKVRVGVTAPRETPVHRQEVFDAIQREKRESGLDDGSMA